MHGLNDLFYFFLSIHVLFRMLFSCSMKVELADANLVHCGYNIKIKFSVLRKPKSFCQFFF